MLAGFVATNIAQLSTIGNYALRKGKPPTPQQVARWTRQIDKTFTRSDVGLPAWGSPCGDRSQTPHGHLPAASLGPRLPRHFLKAARACALQAIEAAEIILGGVERGEWAILVGDDAVALDQASRLALHGSP